MLLLSHYASTISVLLSSHYAQKEGFLFLMLKTFVPGRQVQEKNHTLHRKYTSENVAGDPSVRRRAGRTPASLPPGKAHGKVHVAKAQRIARAAEAQTAVHP